MLNFDSSKRIYIYVTTEKVTSNSASATRILSFCKILKELSVDILVISLDEYETNKIHIHNSIVFISLRNSSNSLLSKVSNILLFGSRLKRLMEKLTKSHKIEGIFFYSIPPTSVLYLKKFALKNQISLFHDSVEWYSPEQFKWKKFALPYVMKDILNKYLVDKQINVFAISSYLNNYYSSKQIRTQRLPIILDIEEISFNKDLVADKIVLLYAGSPGKKDYLKDIVEGLAHLEKEELQKIELQILGINKEQLINDYNITESILEKCGKSILIMGRVSREEVLKYLQKADFTVLLRSPVLRYAKAGFPTKIVESLATATPIICNLTSDLGDYLQDNYNSLIVETCKSEDFSKTLRRAIRLSLEARKNLCFNARKTAELHFDYRKYIKQFNSFISFK